MANEPPKHHFRLSTAGTLFLTEDPTLEAVEEFCKEARRLGVNSQQRLLTTRQGLIGPVSGWYFVIAVQPAKVQDG